MGNAIYRLGENGEKVRVRNVRRKTESAIIRVPNFRWKVDDVICTFFDGVDDMGVIPETPLLAWPGNGAIEAEVLIPSGSHGGMVATQGSDPYPNPQQYGVYKHGISIGATDTYIYANFALTNGTGYPVRYYTDTTKLGWFKLRGEYILGVGGRLYVDDLLFATGWMPSYPLRYGLVSYIGRVPDLYWETMPPYFDGYAREIKYFNGEGELVLHFPLDDADETGIFRDEANGLDAEKIGAVLAGAGGSTDSRRINI